VTFSRWTRQHNINFLQRSALSWRRLYEQRLKPEDHKIWKRQVSRERNYRLLKTLYLFLSILFPFVFFHPLYFISFSLVSLLCVPISKSSFRSTLDRSVIQRPLGPYLHTTSTTCFHPFYPHGPPVRSAPSLATLKLSHLSVSFLPYEKFRCIKLFYSKVIKAIYLCIGLFLSFAYDHGIPSIILGSLSSF
jgi:hypothetical protein